MRDVGFLYVLANSAMQGMVKVGKTTRSPAERAAELSAATGLPTPFIVVYEQLFEDCTEAETFVHTLLASKGFRVADNREFFSAPANEVVRAIALAPGAIEGALDVEAEEEADDELITGALAGDELDDLKIVAPLSGEPWESVFEEAECHYFGFGDFIQDYGEARRLYMQAAKLGSLQAFERLGEIYELGEGVSKSAQKALEFYKEGARKGSLFSYWLMARLFKDAEPPSLENCIKCLRLFIKGFRERETTSKGFIDDARLDLVAMNACRYYVESKVSHYYDLPADVWQFFETISERIARAGHRMVSFSQESGHVELVSRWKQAADYYQSMATR